MTKTQLIEILAMIYNEDGPSEWQGKNLRRVPAEKYAAMDAFEIEQTWPDMPRRHLMHRIARAVAKSPPGKKNLSESRHSDDRVRCRSSEDALVTLI